MAEEKTLERTRPPTIRWIFTALRALQVVSSCIVLVLLSIDATRLNSSGPTRISINIKKRSVPALRDIIQENWQRDIHVLDRDAHFFDRDRHHHTPPVSSLVIVNTPQSNPPSAPTTEEAISRHPNHNLPPSSRRLGVRTGLDAGVLSSSSTPLPAPAVPTPAPAPGPAAPSPVLQPAPNPTNAPPSTSSSDSYFTADINFGSASPAEALSTCRAARVYATNATLGTAVASLLIALVLLIMLCRRRKRDTDVEEGGKKTRGEARAQLLFLLGIEPLLFALLALEAGFLSKEGLPLVYPAACGVAAGGWCGGVLGAVYMHYKAEKHLPGNEDGKPARPIYGALSVARYTLHDVTLKKLAYIPGTDEPTIDVELEEEAAPFLKLT